MKNFWSIVPHAPVARQSMSGHLEHQTKASDGGHSVIFDLFVAMGMSQ